MRKLISLNSKKEMFGYWAYVLTEIANERRIYAQENKKRFFCSGYLFAIRKELFPKLPQYLLAEDGYISHQVYKAGYKIAYAQDAKVYVKYPTNFPDWIKQKKRSAGGYNQIRKIIGVEIRSFKKESRGVLDFFKYVSNLKDKIALIDSSKIFVLPSKSEGMPQSLIEAMARKKIVVGSDIPAIKDIVEDKKTAIFSSREMRKI